MRVLENERFLQEEVGPSTNDKEMKSRTFKKEKNSDLKESPKIFLAGKAWRSVLEAVRIPRELLAEGCA